MSLVHGKYNVVVKDNIIIAKLSGSFNYQGITGYTSLVKTLVEQFDGKPFAMLIDDIQVEGGTPEAYAALNEYNDWLNGQSIVAKAFVINNEVKKQIILANTPALQQQNIDFFIEEKDAENWLRSQLN